MHKRRLARFTLVVALSAAAGSVSLAACGGGATAGDGVTSPPSTNK